MKKIFTLLSLLLVSMSNAQENISFQKPPKEILDLADYQSAPSVSIDTKKEFMILMYRNTYKTLDDLNQEEMRLGGLRVNPIVNISATVTYVTNLKVRNLLGTAEIQVKGLPTNPKMTAFTRSPNEKMMAFTHSTASGVELWILNIASAQATKLTENQVNSNMGNGFSWFNDNETLLVRMLPKNRKPLIDPKKELPLGPTVSTSEGKASQNRTFQDLLKTPTDEVNFENLITSELYKVSISGNKIKFKDAGMYTSESISPDGNFVMVTTISRPFSYIVPLSRFPSKSIVYDKNGVEIKIVNEVPLNEIMPKGFSSVRKGKRNMAWRSDKAASLYFVVALDEGDQAVKVGFRDEIFEWNAPFSVEATSLVKTPQRFGGIIWGNEKLAILYDSWYDSRNEKTYVFNPSVAGGNPKMIFDRNSQDAYSDPGNFETKLNQFNKYVLNIEKDKGFLLGDGFTEKGQFPFIAEYDFKTMKSKRLYTSTYTDKIEEINSFENVKKGDVLVRIQSATAYPNYFIRNIKTKKLTQLTTFENPFESIKNVSKEVIKYTRKDGVELSGTLYLPANYDKTKKEKLPLLIWAYPEEFKDRASAGQNKKNSNEFTFPYYGSFVYWVTRGYAVLDDASFPIIGEGSTEPNDNFMEQLIDNASSAINAVEKLGYIDPKKVAIGGHSYGAFMTANLLTHSNLFACGIARSGAYNRTLTPFGFQNEQRNYWDIPETYNTMSPFMNASKMKTPLLLVHGDADNNPGTFTLQTERYFQALKGLGAPVKMVLLPKESHGYAAKENILHLLWEQDEFLKKWLK